MLRRQRKVLAIWMNLVCGAACTVSAFAAATTQAFTGPSLSLTPAVVVLKGQPGQSTRQQLTLTNDTPVERSFEMVAEDVLIVDGKRMFVPAGEIPCSIAATAVFSPKSVTISPGRSATVEVTLTVPPEVGHRAVAVIFRGADSILRKQVAMSVALGSLFTFTLSDQTAISTSEISVMPQTSSQNAAFSQWITNIGSEPVIPRGAGVVLNESGELVGKVLFDEQRLLPGERLEFKTEYPGELSPGHYRFFATFEFESKTVTSSRAFEVR